MTGRCEFCGGDLKSAQARVTCGERECLRAYKRAWYAQNRSRLIERQADYYDRNRDAIAARQAEYYRRNRDAIEARRRLRVEGQVEGRRAAAPVCPECGVRPREQRYRESRNCRPGRWRQSWKPVCQSCRRRKGVMIGQRHQGKNGPYEFGLDVLSGRNVSGQALADFGIPLRVIRRGMATFWEADEIATRLGCHPSELWTGWTPGALADVDRPAWKIVSPDREPWRLGSPGVDSVR